MQSAIAHHHAPHHESQSAARPLRVVHVPYVEARRVFSMPAGHSAVSARISRKRWALERLRERGEAKVDYVAATLGVSRSFAHRCLSEAYQNEFNERHLAALGLLESEAA